MTLGESSLLDEPSQRDERFDVTCGRIGMQRPGAIGVAGQHRRSQLGTTHHLGPVSGERSRLHVEPARHIYEVVGLKRRGEPQLGDEMRVAIVGKVERHRGSGRNGVENRRTAGPMVAVVHMRAVEHGGRVGRHNHRRTLAPDEANKVASQLDVVLELAIVATETDPGRDPQNPPGPIGLPRAKRRQLAGVEPNRRSLLTPSDSGHDDTRSRRRPLGQRGTAGQFGVIRMREHRQRCGRHGAGQLADGTRHLGGLGLLRRIESHSSQSTLGPTTQLPVAAGAPHPNRDRAGATPQRRQPMRTKE